MRPKAISDIVYFSRNILLFTTYRIMSLHPVAVGLQFAPSSLQKSSSL